MSKDLIAEKQRRGHTVYVTNPSMIDKLPSRVTVSKQTKLGETYRIVLGTGEIISDGALGFLQEKEVDTEEFVKTYRAGVKKFWELTKPGLLIFDYVHETMCGAKGKNKDTIEVNYSLAQIWRPSLGRQTYFKGMKEMLDKEFLYRSLAADVYFVNVRFMFNGDRLILAQSYRRKSSKSQQKLDEQKELR